MSSIHFRKNIDYYYIIFTSNKLIYLIIGNCAKWFQVIRIKLCIFHMKTVYFYFYDKPFDLFAMKCESEIVLTLRRSLRRKLRMSFDVSKVKESSFFKSNLSDPPQIFDAHLLENADFSISRFHFSVGFYQDHILSQTVL